MKITTLMNRIVISATLFTAITAMMVFSILPANASHISGEITWVNNAEKHGTIVRDVDGTEVTYQFTIPRDLQDGYSPVVGDVVNFALDPANSRHATDVGFGTTGGGCPPDCPGGMAF